MAIAARAPTARGGRVRRIARETAQPIIAPAARMPRIDVKPVTEAAASPKPSTTNVGTSVTASEGERVAYRLPRLYARRPPAMPHRPWRGARGCRRTCAIPGRSATRHPRPRTWPVRCPKPSGTGSGRLRRTTRVGAMGLGPSRQGRSSRAGPSRRIPSGSPRRRSRSRRPGRRPACPATNAHAPSLRRSTSRKTMAATPRWRRDDHGKVGHVRADPDGLDHQPVEDDRQRGPVLVVGAEPADWVRQGSGLNERPLVAEEGHPGPCGEPRQARQGQHNGKRRSPVRALHPPVANTHRVVGHRLCSGCPTSS